MGVMVQTGPFQYSINFEPLNQISNTEMFYNQLTVGQQVLIFNYFHICLI